MTQPEHKPLEDLMRPNRGRESRTTPPADLLDKIKSEIPDYLALAEEPRPRRPGWLTPRSRLLAATLAVAVLGGLVASRVLVDRPRAVPAAVQPELDSPLGERSTALEAHAVDSAAKASSERVPEPDPAPAKSEPPAKAPSPAAKRDTIAGPRQDTSRRPASEPAPDPRLRAGVASSEIPNPGAAVPPEADEDGRSERSLPHRRQAGKLAGRRAPAGQAAAEREAFEETTTVTSESPLLDERQVAAGTSISQVELEALPTARDPWAIVEDEEGGETPEFDISEDPAIPQTMSVGRKPGRESVEDLRPQPGEFLEPPPRDRERSESRKRRLQQARPEAPPSTGGTVEPNDRPYGDVFFEPPSVNPFVDTEDDNLSTFGLDVDTGSYTIARRYLDDGHLPPPGAIRVEEFVNFFDYGDRPPRGEDFAILLEGAPSPFSHGPRYQLVRVGIKAREIPVGDRRPANLVFVVDTSGSMERGDRLGLVKRALTMLLDELDRDDRVGLVEYSDRARILLEPTRDKHAVERALRRLVPQGSTNAEEGLLLGYDLVDEFFVRGGVNRVILCSDGVANVGRTGPDPILERIERESIRGIEITTVGFGMGNYNDVLMEQLADRGNGRYVYVDRVEEARRVFVEDLTGTLQTVGRDAKIQVAFNADVVSRYRLLGYENRDIADRRFRDDSIDAGEVGSGHTVSALYEIKLREEPSGRAKLAQVSLRWRSAESGRVREIQEALRTADLARSWRRSSPSLQLAALVAEFAEILKRSYWAKDSSFADIEDLALDLDASLRHQADVAEFLGLVSEAARQQHSHERARGD